MEQRKVSSLEVEHMRELKAKDLKYEELNECKRNMESEYKQKIDNLNHELEVTRSQLHEVREANKSTLSLYNQSAQDLDSSKLSFLAL